VTGEVRVFEGHAFIVEAAVSVGGRELKPGINVYRFANRIPLLFEGGSDVITRTATKRINWGAYKINQSSDKVRKALCFAQGSVSEGRLTCGEA
jgi:DNA topoisomerase VI subunit B